jgi:hypothetical protein
VGLVVDRVEGGDEIEGPVLVERGRIPDLESDVVQPAALGFGPGPSDRLLGKVVTHETALRELLCEANHGSTRAAADVQDVDAQAQSSRQVGNERQNRLEQNRVDRLTTVLGHHLVEAVEPLVGDTAAVAEALHDLVLDSAEHGNVLRQNGQIVRRRGPGQKGGVLVRKVVGLLHGVVEHDAAHRHGGQPLAHVPLVAVDVRCQLLARHSRQGREAVEEADTVTDARHQRRAGMVEDLEQALGEGLGPLGAKAVDLGNRRAHVQVSSSWVLSVCDVSSLGGSSAGSLMRI